MLELSGKGFKTGIIKKKSNNYEHASNKWKNNSQQRNRRYKEEPNGDLKTEIYNNQNEKCQWIGSTVERISEQEDSITDAPQSD